MTGVTPYLQVTDCDAAIDWYARVFDARETRTRLVAPNGACMNAEIEIEGTRLMLADEMPSIGSVSPQNLGGSSVVLSLHVGDVDRVFAKALDRGAEAVIPVADQFHGDRAGRLRDPFGHHWIVATRLATLSDADTVAAFQRLFG